MPWGNRKPKELGKKMPTHCKDIDWEKVDNMLIAGANGTQVAASIGIHHDTLYDRCAQEKQVSFSSYSQEKRAKGDTLLHAAQFQKAVKEKNPTMMIWLGKQRLNQRENHDATPTNDKQIDLGLDQIKNLDIEMMMKTIEDQAKELNELKSKANSIHSTSDETF